MGLFRPYETSEPRKDAGKPNLTPKPTKVEDESDRTPTTAAASSVTQSTTQRGEKKSAPTPTRRAAEAARMERIHPTLTRKEARRKARDASRERNEDAWSRAEQSSERQLLRDYVDSRWTFVEFMLPLMLVFLALTMLSGWINQPNLTMTVTFALWTFLIACIVNISSLWRGFKRELATRHPKVSTRGLLMYLVNRSMMIRRFRRPAPRINRGDSF